jgi:hypothetical protein
VIRSHVSHPIRGQDASCTLSKKTRIIGFASCLSLGLFFSLLSFWFIAKPTSFALLYTLGNVVAVLSTGFLVGFKRQAKAAFARKRVIATVLFLGAMIGTLLAIFLIKTGGWIVAIFCIIVQFCALVWYTASYIPFAQSAISSAVTACFRR